MKARGVSKAKENWDADVSIMRETQGLRLRGEALRILRIAEE